MCADQPPIDVCGHRVGLTTRPQYTVRLSPGLGGICAEWAFSDRGSAPTFIVYLPRRGAQQSSPAALPRRHQVRAPLFKAGAALALTTGIVLMPATAFAAGTVTGTVTCYWPNADGTTTFSVGYVNTSAATVNIPVGANNYVTPAPQDRGQPTNFLAGSHPNVWAPTLTAAELGQNPELVHQRRRRLLHRHDPAVRIQAGRRQRQHRRLPRCHRSGRRHRRLHHQLAAASPSCPGSWPPDARPGSRCPPRRHRAGLRRCADAPRGRRRRGHHAGHDQR